MIGSGRIFKVKIDEVLEALQCGRETHIGIVNEAQEAFRVLATNEMERILKNARDGRKIELTIELEVPTNYTNYYTNAITVLEMTKRAGEEFVSLTSTEIEHYVRNRWSWTNQFLTSSSRYSTIASAMCDSTS